MHKPASREFTKIYEKKYSRLVDDRWLLVKGVLTGNEIAHMHSAWDTFDDCENQIWDVADKQEFAPCSNSKIL